MWRFGAASSICRPTCLWRQGSSCSILPGRRVAAGRQRLAVHERCVGMGVVRVWGVCFGGSSLVGCVKLLFWSELRGHLSKADVALLLQYLCGLGHGRDAVGIVRCRCSRVLKLICINVCIPTEEM